MSSLTTYMNLHCGLFLSSLLAPYSTAFVQLINYSSSAHIETISASDFCLQRTSVRAVHLCCPFCSLPLKTSRLYFFTFNTSAPYSFTIAPVSLLLTHTDSVLLLLAFIPLLSTACLYLYLSPTFTTDHSHLQTSYAWADYQL